MASDFTSPVKVSLLEQGEMEMLQAFLNLMGYNPGPMDGLWGPKTKAAWDQFANNNGIDPGNVNAAVWEAVVAQEPREGYVAGPGGEPIFDQNGGVDVTGPNDGVIDDEELEFIKNNYGSIAYLLDDPEIRELIETAMSEGWNADRLAIAMEDTEWFQETTANQREWDATAERDPATVAYEIDQQAVILKNTADLYGITLTDDDATNMAFRVLRDGTSQDQILREFGTMARAQYAGGESATGDTSGQMEVIKAELEQTARAFHMSYTPDVLNEWAIRIFEGRWSFDAAEATMRNSARAAYPNLGDQLDQGMTLEDFFAPTKNRLASLLEMNPNSIDLTSERWAPVTQMYEDGANGFRPMTYSELGQFARQQDEWWKTDTAIDNSYNALNGILDMFGVI